MFFSIYGGYYSWDFFVFHSDDSMPYIFMRCASAAKCFTFLTCTGQPNGQLVPFLFSVLKHRITGVKVIEFMTVYDRKNCIISSRTCIHVYA